MRPIIYWRRCRPTIVSGQESSRYSWSWSYSKPFGSSFYFGQSNSSFYYQRVIEQRSWNGSHHILYGWRGWGWERTMSVHNNRNYNYQPNNNLPTHYHPGLRNHENFFYANPRNALQPPPGFPQPLAQKKPSCEEMLSTFIMKTKGG